MEYLQNQITYLSGIGPKKAKILQQELKIFNFEDLLYYFPYKYTDRTKFYKVEDIMDDLPSIQLKGKMCSFVTAGEGRKKRLHAEFYDETGTIELVWFKGTKWVTQNVKLDTRYVVYGKPNLYKGKFTISHPEFEELAKYEKKIKSALQSEYNTTEKCKKAYINSKNILKSQSNLFDGLVNKIPETLPDYLKQKFKLISLHEALLNIHFPKNNELLKQAQRRLKFEELFFNQLLLLKQKKIRKNNSKGYVFLKVGDYFNKFFTNELKFELTNAQKRVLKEIRQDFAHGKQANRLLQGDVGSGKTIVAFMSMLIALDNGFQACMMAPTEILAQQHFKTISNFVSKLDITVNILTGSAKTKQRREIDENLQNGDLQILIGTHALIEDTVKFKNLGLVIIDEQHRFGVAQRAKMWKKNTFPPHIIVMTATPIPRTLSMTVYGDLDISTIDELPPGRKSIKTVHKYDSQRLPVFEFIRKQIAQNRQIYIVYPLISESEHFDYKDLEDGYESIVRAFPYPKYTVSVVHGQMKNEDKEKAMQLFVKGQAQILVATTVIEVGVDVPNASVMIIESAEKFGLSQLHQLRGRVGRGNEQSYCILMTGYKLSKNARTRLGTMVETNDGFRIANVDLQLRGPGDIEGTQQSGVAFDFKIADIIKDNKVLIAARETAIQIITNDTKLQKPENEILALQLKKLDANDKKWGMIS